MPKFCRLIANNKKVAKIKSVENIRMTLKILYGFLLFLYPEKQIFSIYLVTVLSSIIHVKLK